jgi:hypothetical protein
VNFKIKTHQIQSLYRHSVHVGLAKLELVFSRLIHRGILDQFKWLELLASEVGSLLGDEEVP